VKLCVARFLSLTPFMPKKFAVIKYTLQDKKKFLQESYSANENSMTAEQF
jgi:hypothetical protein